MDAEQTLAERAKAFLALADNATRGPWGSDLNGWVCVESQGEWGRTIADVRGLQLGTLPPEDEANATFIAAARNDAPGLVRDLLARAEAAEAALLEAEAALLSAEAQVRVLREALEDIRSIPTIYKGWSKDHDCAVDGYDADTGPYWVAAHALAATAPEAKRQESCAACGGSGAIVERQWACGACHGSGKRQEGVPDA